MVDEAQDLLRPGFIGFLDLALRNELEGGWWRFFGDFNHQAIHDIKRIEAASLLRRLEAASVSCTLDENCRNTPTIAGLVEAASELDPIYSRVVRPDDGKAPRMSPYRGDDEQITFLGQELDRLRGEGVHDGDIVVLSFRKALLSAAHKLKGRQQRSGRWVHNLAWMGSPPVEDADLEPPIRYGSIHEFKGLESLVVVITDIESLSSQHHRDLLYTGASRSLSQLRLLIRESEVPHIATLLQRALRRKAGS